MYQKSWNYSINQDTTTVLPGRVVLQMISTQNSKNWSPYLKFVISRTLDWVNGVQTIHRLNGKSSSFNLNNIFYSKELKSTFYSDYLIRIQFIIWVFKISDNMVSPKKKKVLKSSTGSINCRNSLYTFQCVLKFV